MNDNQKTAFDLKKIIGIGFYHRIDIEIIENIDWHDED